MAADSYGAKNEPNFSATGVPSDAADLTAVSEYAALVGNTKVGTNAQRTALTGADVWEQLEFRETDTNNRYRIVSGAWVLVGNDSGWVTMTTFSNSFTQGSPLPQYRLLNGIVYLRGNLLRQLAPTSRAAAFTLPSGFRPNDTLALPFYTVASATDMTIDANGVISIQSTLARTSAPGYPLTGISFPTA